LRECSLSVIPEDRVPVASGLEALSVAVCLVTPALFRLMLNQDQAF
jgi:hypothetical protein